MIEGTRVSVAQVLAELAEGRSLQDLASDMDWPFAVMRESLLELSSELMTQQRYVLGEDQ